MTTTEFKVRRILSINKLGIVATAIPVILLVALLGLSTLQSRPTDMAVDALALNGSKLSTSTFQGKIQVVEYMATWCTTCAKITANIAQYLSASPSSDVVFWSISIDPTHDTPEVFQDYITKKNIQMYADSGSWQFARDPGGLQERYRIPGVPYTYLVGPDLKIVSEKAGEVTFDEIVAWIDGLRQGA